MTNRMAQWFPKTSYPLVVSAPMDFVTNARLATEVSKAGGLGESLARSPSSPLGAAPQNFSQASSKEVVPLTKEARR
jgi:NAD(P)H-dependent flavin oxidoreductase YrpB (nitropropane dioxygenase family)